MVENWNDFIEPLYNDEYKRLFMIAYRWTKDQELAQDLVQDTFLLAIFNQEKIMNHPKPGAWLMQTLRNLIMNNLRSPSHKIISLDEVLEIPARTINDSIERLLPVQLKDREREILIWRFEQQMSYNEMSKRLNVSESLCRKWVSQAVIRCRELLRE